MSYIFIDVLPTKTLTSFLPKGGDVIKLISRRPLTDICRVRGIGVADRVNTSRPDDTNFIFSLCFTPNRYLFI